MNIPIYYLDAFTDKIFSGNPIAICPLKETINDDLMQKIANEINFSETAFVWNNFSDFSNIKEFNLRWFTPTSEVNLCGHGTLGTSSLIFNYFNNINSQLIFNTLSGEIFAKKEDSTIWLNLPKYNYEKYQISQDILEALGIKDFLNCVVAKENETILIEASDIQSIQPDFNKLKQINEKYLGALIVTEKNNSKYDFVSRYFTPWYGINEDPVTGSAHCLLSAYWSDKLNKNQMIAYQLSERGGEINIKLNETSSERVLIGGKAILTLKGELFI